MEKPLRRKKLPGEHGKNAQPLLVALFKPKSPVSEQYRTLRTNILFSSVDQELKTLLVTSTVPGEGKTTTAANLAVVFAQQGKRTLLVDADLRKPSIHEMFDIDNQKGLTTVLTKQTTLEDTMVQRGEDTLYILSSGPLPPNPAELLGSRAFETFFTTAKETFDIVLYDTPPVLVVTDAQIIAHKCDGTILVTSANKTEKQDAVKAKDLLENAGAKLLGAVLNQKKRSRARYHYYHE